MTQRVPDLLPPEEAFAMDEVDPAPIQILQTQGRLLAQRTRGDVRGEVEPVQGLETQSNLPAALGRASQTPGQAPANAAKWPISVGLLPGEAPRMTFWFTLHAPALNYRFRLFLVEHGEEPYPLQIFSNRGGVPVVAHDREQFYDRVKELLSEERTTKLVRQMRQLVAARGGEGG
jgi:hypothetical protein